MTTLNITKNPLSTAITTELSTQQILLLPGPTLDRTTTIKCKNCGATHTYNKKGKGRRRQHCSASCAAEYRDKQPKTKAARRNRLRKYNAKYPERQWHSATKSSAKKREIDFCLDVNLFKSRIQKGVCELTGLPFHSSAGSLTKGRGFYSPSIDRVDNAVGYIPSNVRMVIWGVNLSKNKFADKDLQALSLAMVLAHIPKSGHDSLLELLPTSLIASLPIGHPCASIH
ncbi:hypothetical protein [Cycloclasticus sp. P1]|uniref:hypothetical protein n=1 Tax=Cycloclasticus sp. (strain P1) TaxID=385025 RepID=UPI000286ACA2|nr:hypothetical protein [Cycloclasticus sp. P1]AFT66903.1 hypothetical protein Q91_0865 [Cycloclasticus sp. P1]